MLHTRFEEESTLRWNDPVLVMMLTGLGITLAYTVLTGLIWDATRKNTSATRKILEAAHRPYLAIGPLELHYESMGADPGLRYAITNVSSVPAHIINNYVEVRTLSTRKSYPTPEGNHYALFPGETFQASLLLSTVERPYVQGTEGLEVSISVTYEGATDQRYTTGAKYKYRDRDARFQPVSSSFC